MLYKIRAIIRATWNKLRYEKTDKIDEFAIDEPLTSEIFFLCFFDAVLDLAVILYSRLHKMKIHLRVLGINVRITGILLFFSFVMLLQCGCGPPLLFSNRKIA